MKNIKTLPIASIRRDSGAQFRPSLVDSHVSDIADAIKRGKKLPPVIAFYDETDYWMADGEHRIEGHLKAGKTKIEVDVRPGTQLDARRYGRQANRETLGLKRSPATKRAQVTDALQDPEWANWSNPRIAEYCDVSDEFVRQLRHELGLLTSNVGSQERTYIHNKSGKPTTMKTGNIGAKKGTFASSEAAPEVEVRPDIDLEAMMPFELDLTLEYWGVLMHSDPWTFVDLTPDESGHWSVRACKGLSAIPRITRKGVNAASLSATVQLLAGVTVAQIEAGKWRGLPADAADSVRSGLRATVEEAATIGRSLAEAKEKLDDEQFAQWVEAENGCEGNIEGVPLLIEFAALAERNARSPYYSDANMVTKACDAMRAFGKVPAGYEPDDETETDNAELEALEAA